MSDLDALRERMTDLRADLAGVNEPNALYAVMEPIMKDLERLPPADRAELRAELAGLIAALESRILALEQRLKDNHT